MLITAASLLLIGAYSLMNVFPAEMKWLSLTCTRSTVAQTTVHSAFGHANRVFQSHWTF